MTFDSSLDRARGLDSLARVETPRDLLRLIAEHRAGPAAADAGAAVARPDSGEGGAAPDDARTLVEVLDWHARIHPARIHCHVYGEEPAPEAVTYGRLGREAREAAAALAARGVEPGQAVALMLPTGREYLVAFFGALLAGGVAVPIYPPARPSRLAEHVRRQAAILNNCRATLLIASREVRPAARLLRGQVESLRDVVVMEDLAGAPAAPALPVPRADDLALLQYTSGSTGEPKGVELTHRNLLANIRAMAAWIDTRPGDVMVSWLPLYHDMGLIGAWLGSLCQGLPLALLSPLAFLARPARWLQAIHRHHGTLSAAPNFAWELAARRVADEEIEGVDLGSLRMLFSGAEPVSPETVERFCRRFAGHGLRREAVAPVYGLAECCVGLAFPPPGRGPLVDRVRRAPFERHRRAEPAPGSDADALRFVACGQPLPGHEIRVVDDSGREVPERGCGRIQFRGPSCTRGYHRNPEATRRLFEGDWLDSGDLGYLAAGDLYVTGRSKDIVIRAGRNIYPPELEEAVGGVPGVRRGCVVVLGSRDADSGTERLVVVAESREEDEGRREEIRREIRDVVAGLLDGPPDDVVLAPPRAVPKTSSGKLRRQATREIYEAGAFERREPALGWQLTSLLASALGLRIRRMLRHGAEIAWAAWAWTLFVMMTPVAWLAVVALPGASRRPVLRAAFGFFRRALGVRLEVRGLEHLPAGGGPCVLVSNHQSYVDGIVLTGTLPLEFGFVAKQELAGNLLVRAALARLGTVFVEREHRTRATEALEGARRRLEAGRSLLFFPEGTFDRMPGLLPFRLGAFVIAARARVPVVPVALRGTRDLLRAWSWLPRRVAVTVTVEEPVAPRDPGSEDAWERALELRDLARERILRHCGEPDLAR